MQIKQQQLNSEDPIEAFIYLEANTAYTMLEKIAASLDGLQRTLFGNGLLTSEIQHTGMELLTGTVPARWSSIWDGPDNPTAWL